MSLICLHIVLAYSSLLHYFIPSDILDIIMLGKSLYQ